MFIVVWEHDDERCTFLLNSFLDNNRAYWPRGIILSGVGYINNILVEGSAQVLFSSWDLLTITKPLLAFEYNFFSRLKVCMIKALCANGLF